MRHVSFVHVRCLTPDRARTAPLLERRFADAVEARGGVEELAS